MKNGLKPTCSSCRVADNRLRVLGITVEQYATLAESQGHVCAICKQPEVAEGNGGNGSKALAVDHCHVTKAIRGLLCQRCNLALGYFNDDVATLLSAVAYLSE